MKTIQGKIDKNILSDFQVNVMIFDNLKEGDVKINLAGVPELTGEVIHQLRGESDEAKLTRVLINPNRMVELLGQDSTKEELYEIIFDLETDLNYSKGILIQEL